MGEKNWAATPRALGNKKKLIPDTPTKQNSALWRVPLDCIPSASPSGIGLRGVDLRHRKRLQPPAAGIPQEESITQEHRGGSKMSCSLITSGDPHSKFLQISGSDPPALWLKWRKKSPAIPTTAWELPQRGRLSATSGKLSSQRAGSGLLAP